MPHPRIIRALELIHDAKEQIAGAEMPFTVGLLGHAEDELLRHIAEAKREEAAKVGR